MKNGCFPLFLGIGFLLVILASCSTQSRITHYQGDGEIKANPDYGLIGGGGGYTLKFKSIKLDHPAHFTYHFSGLPRWRAEVLFAIAGPQKWEWRDCYDWYQKHYPSEQRPQVAIINDLKGKLAISLRNAKWDVILQFQRELSELTWSQGGSNPSELYDEQAINFTPDSREYTLEVTIDPDPILKDDEGYVLIRGGGREPISIGF
jgi:hypothetical protein